MEFAGIGPLANSAIEPDELKKLEATFSKIQPTSSSMTSTQVAEFNKQLDDLFKESDIDLRHHALQAPPASESKRNFPIAKKPITPAVYDSESSEESESESDESETESETGSSESSNSQPRRLNNIRHSTIESGLQDIQRSSRVQFEIPREQHDVEKMITEIDIYRTTLQELNYPGTIPEVTSTTDSFEVFRVRNLLRHIVSQQRYTNLIQDVAITMAGLVESYFQPGTYILGRIPVNYEGLERQMTLKIASNRPILAQAVSNLAERYGFNPDTMLLLDFMFMFVSIPVSNYRKQKPPINNNTTQGNLSRI